MQQLNVRSGPFPTARPASSPGARPGFRLFAGLADLFLRSAAPAASVGGQAVMEGVMMRHKDHLAVAVRKPDGSILVERWPWFFLSRSPWLKKPFVRGFPVLIETLVNGIKALNFSATQAAMDPDADPDAGEEAQTLKPWHIALTLALAIALGLMLFVVAPHLFSLGMKSLGLGGDVEGLSFHVWDGFFKLAIFLGYIAGISMLPDIRRVFQYHGAEHKVIWAYEEGALTGAASAMGFSRLHPRCGTAFLLFVLSLSIILHAVLVPLLLAVYTPGNVVLKHTYIVVVKLFLMIPISAVSYELIKYSSRRADKLVCRLLSGPGLLLQRMTTKEPDQAQVEVALAALEGALAEKSPAAASAASVEDLASPVAIVRPNEAEGTL